jgi:hypothetical protein
MIGLAGSNCEVGRRFHSSAEAVWFRRVCVCPDASCPVRTGHGNDGSGQQACGNMLITTLGFPVRQVCMLNPEPKRR